MSKKSIPAILLCLSLAVFHLHSQSYTVVGTAQQTFFDSLDAISAPVVGQSFFGQNAHYPGHSPSYTDNLDGTVSDNVSGLMWQQSADINGDGMIDAADKLTYIEALAYADTLVLAGYDDWRLPDIKTLYSLILFSGLDVSGPNPTTLKPFLDTDYFAFGYGDTASGERIIDAQYASSTLYVSTTMGGNQTMFGVNFADGRIKGYPVTPGPMEKSFYVKLVRGPSYGMNGFIDNGDGTITDQATGLMWMQADNGAPLRWQQALDYAETANFAGYSDWRLPDAKELQSIVDYSRSPATTFSPAIDPLFSCTSITDEGGNTNYPFYWTSTTHISSAPVSPGRSAVYICFGEALGWMEMPPNSGNFVLDDVHGAGAQRADFKTGDPAAYPYGFGPQGDVVRIAHYVRLVRNADPTGIGESSPASFPHIFPNPFSNSFSILRQNAWEGDAVLELMDLQGKLLQQGVFPALDSRMEWNVAGLASGTYFLRMTSKDKVLVVKLIR